MWRLIFTIQVMTMMKSSERLIKRTQPNIGGMPRRLCSCAGTHTDLERDPESFDDSDFYQQLLKEFLEASNPIRAHMPVAIKKKAKPLRDRRASKGRRLRYDVQVISSIIYSLLILKILRHCCCPTKYIAWRRLNSVWGSVHTHPIMIMLLVLSAGIRKVVSNVALVFCAGEACELHGTQENWWANNCQPAF